MPISGQEALGYFRDAGFAVLEISPIHAATAEALPPLHTDPFDRILVARALEEPLRLVYPDSGGIWVYRAQGWCGGGREIKTIPRFRRSLSITHNAKVAAYSDTVIAV